MEGRSNLFKTGPPSCLLICQQAQTSGEEGGKANDERYRGPPLRSCWLPRTERIARLVVASSSGTPDTVPCVSRQLGRAPHEFQHDRAERLPASRRHRPAGSPAEDHGELPLGQDEVVVDVVDLPAGHLA